MWTFPVSTRRPIPEDRTGPELEPTGARPRGSVAPCHSSSPRPSGTCGVLRLDRPERKNAHHVLARMEHRAGDRRRARATTTSGSSRSPATVTPSAPASTWAEATARTRRTPGCRSRSRCSTRRAGSGGSSSRCGSRPTSRWSPGSTVWRWAPASRWRWRPTSGSPRTPPGCTRATCGPGHSPDGGLTWSLPTLVGHEAALRFLLESRFVDADEALPPRARVGGRPRRPARRTAAGVLRGHRRPGAARGTTHEAPGRQDTAGHRRRGSGRPTRSATRSPVSTARTARRRCGRSWRSALRHFRGR